MDGPFGKDNFWNKMPFLEKSHWIVFSLEFHSFPKGKTEQPTDGNKYNLGSKTYNLHQNHKAHWKHQILH